MKNITKIFLILSLFSLNARTVCMQDSKKELESALEQIELLKKSNLGACMIIMQQGDRMDNKIGEYDKLIEYERIIEDKARSISKNLSIFIDIKQPLSNFINIIIALGKPYPEDRSMLKDHEINNSIIINNKNDQFKLLKIDTSNKKTFKIFFEKMIQGGTSENKLEFFYKANVLFIPDQNTELSELFETKEQIYNQEYFNPETNEEMLKLEKLSDDAKINSSKLLFRAINNSLIVLNNLKKITIDEKENTLPGELAGKIINFAGIKDLAGNRINP